MMYFLINDVEYLFRKRRFVLILLCLITIFSSILNFNHNIDEIELVYSILQLNFNIENFNSLELILFLFYVLIFIFLIFDIYIKDLKYQLDNIVLRIDIVKWFIAKTVIFLFLSMFILLSQYIILIIIYFKEKLIITTCVRIIFIHYIYICCIQYVLFLIYILCICYKKFKIIFILCVILFFIYFPKNIISIQKNIFIYIVLIVIAITGLLIIIKNNNKKIIEESEVN